MLLFLLLFGLNSGRQPLCCVCFVCLGVFIVRLERLLSEDDIVRRLGIDLSPGWEHIFVFKNKLRELVLRRPLTDDQCALKPQQELQECGDCETDVGTASVPELCGQVSASSGPDCSAAANSHAEDQGSTKKRKGPVQNLFTSDVGACNTFSASAKPAVVPVGGRRLRRRTTTTTAQAALEASGGLPLGSPCVVPASVAANAARHGGAGRRGGPRPSTLWPPHLSDRSAAAAMSMAVTRQVGKTKLQRQSSCEIRQASRVIKKTSLADKHGTADRQGDKQYLSRLSTAPPPAHIEHRDPKPAGPLRRHTTTESSNFLSDETQLHVRGVPLFRAGRVSGSSASQGAGGPQNLRGGLQLTKTNIGTRITRQNGATVSRLKHDNRDRCRWGSSHLMTLVEHDEDSPLQMKPTQLPLSHEMAPECTTHEEHHAQLSNPHLNRLDLPHGRSIVRGIPDNCRTIDLVKSHEHIDQNGLNEPISAKEDECENANDLEESEPENRGENDGNASYCSPEVHVIVASVPLKMSARRHSSVLASHLLEPNL
eukprot:GHVT01029493.1.p1 GENE.GHVT01029493.1~~GHVT01029493.1.p1  ORF type:complete len:540 (+),score=48.62 GHVT01029493.1:1659-3278(+)